MCLNTKEKKTEVLKALNSNLEFMAFDNLDMFSLVDIDVDYKPYGLNKDDVKIKTVKDYTCNKVDVKGYEDINLYNCYVVAYHSDIYPMPCVFYNKAVYAAEKMEEEVVGKIIKTLKSKAHDELYRRLTAKVYEGDISIDTPYEIDYKDSKVNVKILKGRGGSKSLYVYDSESMTSIREKLNDIDYCETVVLDSEYRVYIELPNTCGYARGFVHLKDAVEEVKKLISLGLTNEYLYTNYIYVN